MLVWIPRLHHDRSGESLWKLSNVENLVAMSSNTFIADVDFQPTVRTHRIKLSTTKVAVSHERESASWLIDIFLFYETWACIGYDTSHNVGKFFITLETVWNLHVGAEGFEPPMGQPDGVTVRCQTKVGGTPIFILRGGRRTRTFDYLFVGQEP